MFNRKKGEQGNRFSLLTVDVQYFEISDYGRLETGTRNKGDLSSDQEGGGLFLLRCTDPPKRVGSPLLYTEVQS